MFVAQVAMANFEQSSVFHELLILMLICLNDGVTTLTFTLDWQIDTDVS